MGKLRILCGSWNVNAKSPKSQDLRKWVCTTNQPPDIIGASCQEIVDLTDMTQYMQSKTSGEASENWAKAIVKALESHGLYNGTKYTVLAVSQLVGVMTCVVVKTEHINKISDVKLGICSVGKLGMSNIKLGNKGAVSIRFQLSTGPHKYKSFCFVGAHFSAHQNEVAKRNADYKAIASGLQFQPLLEKKGKTPIWQLPNNNQPIQHGTSMKTASMQTEQIVVHAMTGEQKHHKILDHDVVFWVGDLNYRIDKFSWSEAVQHIKAKNRARLVGHDQLNKARQKKQVFQSFKEGALNFDPTYKYKPGTSNYDIERKEGDKKKIRVPAWCDRILWQNDEEKNKVEQLSYVACPSFTPSDHKPIAAEFVLPFIEIASKQSSKRNLGFDFIQSVCAVKEFTGKSKEEISFRVGDLLELFPKEKVRIDDGWILGRHCGNNSVGYFPSDHVNTLGATKSKSRPDTHKVEAIKASALRYDRKRAELLKARLAESERPLTCVDRAREFLDTICDFVFNEEHRRVRQLSESEEYLDHSKYDKMKAVKDHRTNNSEELPFKRDQVVTVVSMCPTFDNNSGWFVAKLQNGHTGLVPRASFVPVQTKAQPAAAQPQR